MNLIISSEIFLSEGHNNSEKLIKVLMSERSLRDIKKKALQMTAVAL